MVTVTAAPDGIDGNVTFFRGAFEISDKSLLWQRLATLLHSYLHHLLPFYLSLVHQHYFRVKERWVAKKLEYDIFICCRQ
jgi:hypothetical protein